MTDGNWERRFKILAHVAGRWRWFVWIEVRTSPMDPYEELWRLPQ